MSVPIPEAIAPAADSLDIGRDSDFQPMGKPMDTPVPTEGARLPRFAGPISLYNSRFVASLFVGLIAVQALGFLMLGTNREGRSVSLVSLVAQNFLAIACAWIAFRRARNVAALFWFLFAISLLILQIPQTFGTYDTVFTQSTLSESTWRVLFCLYGAPILMMVFLPETDRERVKSEIFLDLFQVAIIVGLTFTSLFLVPVQQMLPTDALLRNISVSNLESFFLLAAVAVRLVFARNRGTRALLLRLGFFLVACAVVTYIGNWIDLHHYATASAWFDLGWALPYVVAGLVAFTWTAPSEMPRARVPTFLSLLGTNLVLVAVLVCMNLMLDDWKRAHGAMLTDAAVAALLLAFTLRLALTQYAQQQEIVQRKAAQDELSVANQTISGLLEEARIETGAITQISELSTLLQACGSGDEAFRVIPERMVRLFPGTSGALSVLNVSRTRAESVAEWGLRPPRGLPGTLTDSGPVRSGPTPALTGEDWALRREQSDSASVSIPLIANDEALGVLALRDDADASLRSRSNELTQRRQFLAHTLSKHIALTISNLALREALQGLAIRDPLTGLYNRRYMQEFLDREIHRSRRSERPLSLMMIDIDYFKRYNDNFGHPAGDDALRLVGDALRQSVRAEDLACRYGGEEFVLILPECALEPAAVRAEQVRTHLEELYVERAGELPGSVTISIGVAGFRETTDKLDLLLKFADKALYQAKHDGRDRVVVARPEQKDSPSSLHPQTQDDTVAVAPE
jgi:diguanylate cyclase (GGDEF)-like protein